jgi:hypothetical protein
MKGISLPINAIVIIVLILAVLLVVSILFFNVLTSSGKTTNLESATKSVCQKVSMFCRDIKNNAQPRIPVDDFDANKDGVINEHTYDTLENQVTTYCIDDNLEALCGFYYGCKINPCPSGDKTGFDPHNQANYNLVNEVDWKDWHQCCMVKVCGCPQ